MDRDFRNWAVLFGVVGLSLVLAEPSFAQGRVRGEVEDSWGNKLEGVTVTAESAGPLNPVTATTDDDGRFGMAGVKGGQWLFTAAADGYQSGKLQMNVSWLEMNRVSFELEALTSGRFKDTINFASDPAGTTYSFGVDGQYTFKDGEGEGMGTYNLTETGAELTVREYDGPDDKFSVTEPIVAETSDAFLSLMIAGQKLLAQQ